MKKGFVISALALASLHSIASEVYDVQRDELDKIFQHSNSKFKCEYLQFSWWNNSLKASYLLDLDLKSKTLLVTAKDSNGRMMSKKTYKIVIWEQDSSNNIVINALTTDTEVPEVRLAQLDVQTKQMELQLRYINGKHEVASIQCK